MALLNGPLTNERCHQNLAIWSPARVDKSVNGGELFRIKINAEFGHLGGSLQGAAGLRVVISEGLHLAVAGIAFTILDAQNRVVGNPCFSGYHSKLTYVTGEPLPDLMEHVFFHSAAIIGIYASWVSRHTCLSLGAMLKT